MKIPSRNMKTKFREEVEPVPWDGLPEDEEDENLNTK